MRADSHAPLAGRQGVAREQQLREDRRGLPRIAGSSGVKVESFNDGILPVLISVCPAPEAGTYQSRYKSRKASAGIQSLT
jgi:hypothetical protein